jgi:hypothetical protein
MPHEKAEGYDGKGLLKDLMGCGDIIKRKLLRPLCEPKPWGHRACGNLHLPSENYLGFGRKTRLLILEIKKMKRHRENTAAYTTGQQSQREQKTKGS